MTKYFVLVKDLVLYQAAYHIHFYLFEFSRWQNFKEILHSIEVGQVCLEKFVKVRCKLPAMSAIIIHCITAFSLKDEHAQRCKKKLVHCIVFSLAMVCHLIKHLMKIWKIAAHDFT